MRHFLYNIAISRVTATYLENVQKTSL
jgi:hypothetical protein